MSWLFSRALVEAFSPDKCSDGEPSVQSSGKPIPQAYLQRDKTTATWSRFPSGMTCEPLTAGRGEELLTSFRAAFPARTSAPPEKEPASKASDPACGWKWPESSVKYDPVSSSWKTRQCSLLGGLVEFSETWPRWGSMRNGECWEQPMLERRTSETESGLWPTPNCIGFRSDGELQMLAKKLTDRAEYVAMSHRACRSKRERFWPTPTSRDHKGVGPNGRIRDGKLQLDTLDRAVHHQNGSGSLNPTWVEWLMGWPTEWTALKPLETAKSPNVPQKRGAA